jgi:hypothetical protein
MSGENGDQNLNLSTLAAQRHDQFVAFERHRQPLKLFLTTKINKIFD